MVGTHSQSRYDMLSPASYKCLNCCNSSCLVNNDTVIYMMAFDPNGSEYYVSANDAGRITGEFVLYTINS